MQIPLASSISRIAIFTLASFVLLLPQKAYSFADSILVFNELHYNPADDLADTEWIEFHNLNGVNVDVSGWRLRGGVDFDFPEGTVVDGHGFLLVAANPANAKLAGKGALGPFVGSLNNGGEIVRIENRDGRTMNSLSYGDSGDWPVGADGSGATLTKRDQGTADNRPANWVASREIGGTPGAANFPLAGAPPVEIETRLFDWDAVWRYNETDAQAVGWEDDAHTIGVNWLSGAGPLGFENSPPIAIGTQLAVRDVITYYFEREFTLTQSQIANLTQLKIEHLFDDGGVVYVNGVEVFRDDMPAGVPNSETLGLDGSDPNPSAPIGVSTGSLVVGTNRISVEVHQVSLGSSDVLFGLRAMLVEEPAEPGAAVDNLVFNEFSAHDAAGGFRLELTNISGSTVNLAGYSLGFSEGGTMTFTSGIVEAGGFAEIDQSTLGFAPGDNDRLFLYSPEGKLIDARRVTRRLRGRAAEFDGRWLYPDVETFGAANTFSIESDIVINEIMYHPRPQPASPDTPAVFDTVMLLDWGATWRYNDANENLPAAWATTTHPTGGNWSSGAGPIGRESGTLEVPLATDLAGSYTSSTVTYYFEAEFEITAQQFGVIDSLNLTHQIDDGAVFYLNGAELGRFNFGANPFGPETLSSPSVGNAAVQSIAAPASALAVGTNRISVEVHQSSTGSSDMVFGVQLLAQQEISPFIPGEPFRSSEETWIELHNRSADRSIELGGWSFSDGVAFDFPAGASLSPGGYLVVARDAAALSAKHPAADVIGQFSGGLSRSGERLRLVDANSNPVDEVRYSDGGRWPGNADGGASSLELRDPDADNSIGDAWSASEETQRGSWNNYTRTARAINGQSDPGNYHEFIFGLLDEGELLIDDVSVIEDPGTGSARELIQNGDFSSGNANFWRMRGTHRHFEVIDDPDAPGNKVLHVSASGSTEHMHNSAETTLKSGASFVTINSSKTYQISFRARWVSGTNQLNSRLYFNRIPRTDILAIDDPHGGGTPGAPNSTLEANAGPTFASAIHDPSVPAANQGAEITAYISDPDGVASATVHYSVNSGAFQQTSMSGAAGGRFIATIPGQSMNARVQFYIEAMDTLGASSSWPREGAESRAMIPWQDNQARLQRGSVFPTNLRIVMPTADAAFLHTVTEVMSNDRLPCTVIHNEQTIYYGCRVRLKSSQRGRSTEGRVGFNIRFPSDNRFLGAHSSISCDRSGQNELMVKHMAAQVGDVPAMFDDVAWVIQPRANRATSAILMKSRFDDEWLSNQIPNGSDGRMFKFELIYHPNGTNGVPNSQEGLKVPQPDGVSGVPMRNQGGENKELYRWHWLIRNNRDADDYSGIINLLNTMGLSGAAYNAVIEDVMDTDQWLRTFAYLNLTGIGDNYGTHGSGAWHNAIFYIRPTDGKAMFFPWDMDFTFSNSATSGVTPSTDLNKIIGASPANERAYYGHLLDMIETTFNTAYMNEWLSHYSQFLDSGLTGNSGYISTRGNHVRNLINNAVANVAFGVSTSSGGSTVNSTTTVRGDGWVDVRELRLAGALTPLAVRWTDDNSWEVTLPVAPGANNFTIEAIGFDGAIVDSDSFAITGTGTVVPVDASNLAISEIHYNPLPPDAAEISAGFTDASMFEWFELLNLSSTATIDLGNIAFTSGITLVIPEATTLAAGERLVVPANVSAFTTRYGALAEGRLLALPFLEPDGSNKFANGGERVELLSAASQTIADFTYSDARPWPVSADGSGYSLTLMCPDRNDPTRAKSWRSSAAPGGSPGSSDAIPLATWQTDNGIVDLLSDSDLDGNLALIEYLNGTDPATPGGSAVTVEVSTGGDLRLEVRQRIGADEVDILAERAGALMDWSSADVEYWGRENNGDGSATLRFRTPATGFVGGDGFLRLSVSENE